MSEAKLPEELLREILSLLLSVSEEDFCKFPGSGLPPWMDQKRRARLKPRSVHACHVLTVSKRWLRVGTPLLYHSVRVWNPVHAKAVAALLGGNPVVGQAVRCLRIEGACGRDLYTIVKHAPNIHTLYIGVQIKASEGIAGLRKALPLLQPKRLYWIHLPSRRASRVAGEAKELLLSCVAGGWTSLKSVVLDWDFKMTGDIMAALSKAPALETLIRPNNRWVRDWIKQGFFQTISRNPSLKEFRMVGLLLKDEHLEELCKAGAPERVVKMFTFVDKDTSCY